MIPIRIEQLTLDRNHQRVLEAVTLQVAAGEIVCLLGASGSGKSSLLRCINRLTEPPLGTVFLDGTDVCAMNVLALRQRVGMVFQQVTLFPGTVGTNVGYGPALHKRTLAPADMTRFLDLADLPADIVTQNSQMLSGGQAQRVALARTLATEPAILLLDEPTSALDPLATRHIEATMLKLRQTLGLTMLWVTHSAEQARQVADRVYLLDQGRIVDTGTPEHLFRAGSQHRTALFAAGKMD